MNNFETATVNAYVKRIVDTYDAATVEQAQDGAEWYPAMARIMREHALRSGLSVAQVAGVYAATSINTSWASNLKLAARAIDEGSLTDGTLTLVCDKVNAILSISAKDDHAALIDAALTSDDKRKKLRNFWRNLTGDGNAVTVDRWAQRIATGDYASKSVPQGREYDLIAACYRIAANLRNVSPATIQAVTWCVARKDGK